MFKDQIIASCTLNIDSMNMMDLDDPIDDPNHVHIPQIDKVGVIGAVYSDQKYKSIH